VTASGGTARRGDEGCDLLGKEQDLVSVRPRTPMRLRRRWIAAVTATIAGAALLVRSRSAPATVAEQHAITLTSTLLAPTPGHTTTPRARRITSSIPWFPYSM
jgi:predicted cobalt transporter CbtA